MQIISQKKPYLKIAEIANIVGISKITVSRRKNKSTFMDKKRKRNSKMTQYIKNFIL